MSKQAGKPSSISLQSTKLSDLFQQSPAFICTLHGPEHVFELANNRYLQLVGFRDVVGQPVAKALPEVVDQGFIKLLDTVYQTGKPFIGNEIVVSLQREKGAPLEERYVNFIYQAMKDEQDKVFGIFVHGVDVTDQVLIRKQIEESERKLQESENRFKKYTEAMPQMAFMADAKGNITFFNERWYEFVGGLEDTEGWGWKDKPIHHPDDLQKAIDRWSHSLETGEPYEIEYRLRRHDGEYRWHLGRALPVTDDSGKILQWLGTNTDIHEQKLAIQHKDDFLAIASHELKTPVTSIKAYTQVLERNFRNRGDDKTANTLERVNAQIDKLTNLIGDLLDVTKIQSGKLVFHRDYFDSNALIEEIVEEVVLSADTHQIEKELDETVRIFGDRDRIGQVLTNLLTNAIKYSPDAKKVVVATKIKKEYLEISVQDFGIGIPQEKQAEVFKQFFRVTDDGQSAFPGLGLGLYISSEIVRRSGGKIWVESTVGSGSIFYFTLPLEK